MADVLAELESQIVDCRVCPRLVAWREETATTKRKAFEDQDYWGRPVPGFGDPNAQIVLVGLAPGAHGANRTGRNFTGDPSGDFLYASLHRTGFANQPESIDRHDGLEITGAWITATVKCVPPQNKPTAAETNACRDMYLATELAHLSPRVIVALGGLAWTATCRELYSGSPRPKFGHGAEVQLDSGATLVGCYHPSPHNTYTGRLEPQMMDAVFARARTLAQGTQHS